MRGNRIEVEGVAGVDAALRDIPGITHTTANVAIGDWSLAMESRVKAAGRASDRQSRMVSRSVIARKGQGGTITAGGPGQLPTGSGSYGDVFFGAEFGGGARPTTKQFRQWRPHGYWFFPTIEPAEDTSLIDAAADGLDAAARRWAD